MYHDIREDPYGWWSQDLLNVLKIRNWKWCFRERSLPALNTNTELIISIIIVLIKL